MRATLLPLLSALACTPPSVVGDDTGLEDPPDTEESGLDDTGDTGDTGDTETDPSSDELWEHFLDEREGYLLALAEPIQSCAVRTDTSHPAFHGCIDWHSAVHANWALHALTRLTGDEAYRETAETVLDEASLEGELAQLDSGAIAGSELPYGYSWFLTLARERSWAGAEDLAPLAEVVMDDLYAHAQGLNYSSLQAHLVDDDYQNLSWEALNLWQWASHVEDSALEAEIETWIHDWIVPQAGLCPLQAEHTNTSDFFPPCLHLARLAMLVLPEDERGDWLAEHLPDDFELRPLTTMSSAHSGGLNFSRSWGLWALWQATGDTHFRDLYVEHIETHVGMPQYWAENYYSYSHWVPQFGVYGIALSYEE